MRTILALAVCLAASGAGAQDFRGQRELNALRDAARSEERQARSIERIERQDRERARDEDRARRNAARDSRSSRRFDR